VDTWLCHGSTTHVRTVAKRVGVRKVACILEGVSLTCCLNCPGKPVGIVMVMPRLRLIVRFPLVETLPILEGDEQDDDIERRAKQADP